MSTNNKRKAYLDKQIGKWPEWKQKCCSYDRSLNDMVNDYVSDDNSKSHTRSKRRYSSHDNLILMRAMTYFDNARHVTLRISKSQYRNIKRIQSITGWSMSSVINACICCSERSREDCDSHLSVTVSFWMDYVSYLEIRDHAFTVCRHARSPVRSYIRCHLI